MGLIKCLSKCRKTLLLELQSYWWLLKDWLEIPEFIRGVQNP